MPKVSDLRSVGASSRSEHHGDDQECALTVHAGFLEAPKSERPLITLETVGADTPAIWAISAIV
jgi:hypothetical protein